MAKQWKTGDKVRHMSGGSEMVVVKQESRVDMGDPSRSGEYVICEWRDKNGNPQRGEFLPDALVPA